MHSGSGLIVRDKPGSKPDLRYLNHRIVFSDIGIFQKMPYFWKTENCNKYEHHLSYRRSPFGSCRHRHSQEAHLPRRQNHRCSRSTCNKLDRPCRILPLCQGPSHRVVQVKPDVYRPGTTYTLTAPGPSCRRPGFVPDLTGFSEQRQYEWYSHSNKMTVGIIIAAILAI